MIGASSIVNNSDTKKWMYSGYGIIIDGKSMWSFGNYYAKNVIIFGFDNSSSSHADNRKNNFLVLGQGHTFGNNGSFGKKRQEKSLV